MAQRDPFQDDIPSPGAEAPFHDPANVTGGYLAGGDDKAIRKIRRRVTPFGKVAFVVVLGALGGTGYFVYKSARDEAALARETERGRGELTQILGQTLPPEELARRVRDVYAGNHAPEVRASARRILAGLRDPLAVPLLIEGLRGGTSDRRQSALGLAEIGLPAAAAARDALMEVLPRTDPRTDRVEVAWALVALSDARAWDTVLGLLANDQLQRVRSLEEPPRQIFDPALVARMGGPTRLMALVTDQRLPLRRLAALGMSELASPEVVPGLLALSRDADIDVAREASIGLGRSGDPQAGDAIVAFLNRQPQSRDAVLTALSQNAGAQGVGVVIRAATDVTTRAAAVRLLGALEDPGAGEALMAAVATVPADSTDEQLRTLRKNAIFGMADIGDVRAAPGLMDLIERPFAPGAVIDPNMDSDTREALRRLVRIPGAATQVKARLLAVLPRADFVRTMVLLALAATEDATLGERMMPFLADEQAQDGAAVGVCRLHYAPGVARVRADMRRPPALHMVDETAVDEPVFIHRRNAINAIAWTRDATIAPDLMRIIEDPLDRRLLREVAGYSLTTVADAAALEDVATRALDTTRPEDVRLYYLRALRGRSTPANSNRIVAAYIRPGTSEPLLRAAAIAAGFGGDASTAALLRPLFASSDANVRLNAAIAGVLCGDNETAAALLTQLSTDRELPDLLTNVFVTRSRTGDNTGFQPEPFDLLPVTEEMFTDGRIYRRIEMATALERGRGTQRFDFAMVWLKLRVRNGWEDNAVGIGRHAIRARLRDAATGTDAMRREMAFRMLRALGDRGSLLALLRGTGDAAEQARRVLLEMAGSP